MLKNIYIIFILSIWFCGSSFALIQVTDWIFPSDNNASIAIKNPTTSLTWGSKKITTNSQTWFVKQPNKTLVSTLWSWLSADIDFVQWLKWMHENWLTSYSEVNAYRPYDKVTREEMAKILAKLYEAEWLNLNSNEACAFKDWNKFSSEISPYIYKVCSLGIMKWAWWYFSPSKTLTRAQWLATIVRLFEEKNLDESRIPRYSSYYERWLELNFIPSTMKSSDMEAWLSRYRLAKLIYMFHIKSHFRWEKKLLNEVNYKNFIDIIPDTIFINEDKSYIMKMNIKWNILITNWWETLDAILDNNLNLKIVKITSTNKNQDKSSFVRYGDVYNQNYDLVWSCTFIYNNNNIKEWYIRINNDKTVYKISPSDELSNNIYDIVKKNY